MKKRLKEDRRFGRIEFTRNFLWDANIDDLQKVFSNFIVIDSRPDFFYDRIEHTCYCRLFREIDEGEVTPKYEITLHQVQGNFSHITVEEVDE